jgi:isocitrate dehydrogenase (NAD+)
MAKHTVTLIPGDGIGPELTTAMRRVVEATGVDIEWETVEAGAGVVEKYGTPLPEHVLESIRRTKVAIKGPITTPVGKGFRSVNVALRKELDLYACLRPAKTMKGVKTRFDDIDLVVVRENTQGMYAGVEHFVDDEHNAAESISIITRKGSERIVEYAFQYAKTRGRKRVTLVHKANILKCTSGLFLETGRAVAARHPEIEFKEMIVDNCAMQLVKNPNAFDIIVTTNLFGDILSDLTSGLIGGLGLTAGANIGKDAAIFEAVHGTAPDIAGKGVANPTAVMLAGAMLLEHIGERTASGRLITAIREAIASKEAVTPDLGGSATSRMFTNAVLQRLK